MNESEATPEEPQGLYSYTFQVEADVDAYDQAGGDLFTVYYEVKVEAEDYDSAYREADAKQRDYCGPGVTVAMYSDQQDMAVFERLVQDQRFVAGVQAAHAGGDDELVLRTTGDPRAQPLIGE